MKKTNMTATAIKSVAAATLSISMLCALPAHAMASTTQVSRLCGETRYETAYETSKTMASKSNTIIVASGENFPDALAASALAGTENAPILLTSKDALSDDISRWIERNQTTKVYIVGGQAAISSNVESALKSKSVATERIAGETRQDTADSIASHVSNVASTQTVIIASSSAPWDSLSVSPYSNITHSPVFLAEQDGTLSVKSINAIKASGATKAIIVGGPNAVSNNAEQALKRSMNVERWAGQTRYETSQLIAQNAIANGAGSMSYVAFASGENFPDALSGGPVVGSHGGILLLTQKNSSELIKNWILSNRSNIQSCYTIGGCGAISPYAFSNIESMIVNGQEAAPATTQAKANATNKAKNYLEIMYWSRQKLVDQLKYEGFSTEEAEYGTNAASADWNNQAVLKGMDYFNSGQYFSYKGLIGQLTSDAEKFTDSQAQYAADNIGANWDDMARMKAEQYQKLFSFSRSQMINQLLYDGFTQEQAECGASHVGL